MILTYFEEKLNTIKVDESKENIIVASALIPVKSKENYSKLVGYTLTLEKTDPYRTHGISFTPKKIEFKTNEKNELLVTVIFSSQLAKISDISN